MSYSTYQMSNATLHSAFDILKVECDFSIAHAHSTKTTVTFPRSYNSNAHNVSRMRLYRSRILQEYSTPRSSLVQEGCGAWYPRRRCDLHPFEDQPPLQVVPECKDQAEMHHTIWLIRKVPVEGTFPSKQVWVHPRF